MTTPAELCVLLGGADVGRLRRSRRGHVSFEYDHRYAAGALSVPLSLSMPLAAEPYGDEATRRWISSLLPDHPRTLARWHDAYGASDAFGLLATPVGYDCAGAVQFCRAGHLDEMQARPDSLRLLTAQEMSERVALMAQDPAGWTVDDLEPCYSLAGFQNKMALHRTNEGWALPGGAVASTHILKPRHRDAGSPAIVEHLCAAAARNVGLDAVASTVEFHDGHPVTVIERYDRASHRGQWRRLHQEDMCQALGRDGQLRHEHAGGPGMSEISDLIRAHSVQPEADIRKFADGLLWALVTVNRDAHARNYSILLDRRTGRLAPLYDLQSSLPYVTARMGERQMAMRYGSGFTVYSSNSAHSLIDTAARLRLPADWVIDRAEALAAGAVEAFRGEANRLPLVAHEHLRAEELLDRLRRRCESVAKTAAANRRRLPSRPSKQQTSALTAARPTLPVRRKYQRPAIEAALAANPQATYAQIAQICGVSASYVGKIARAARRGRR